MSGSNFGVIGLGTMGRNLALNIESHGYHVAVWNLETDWITDFISKHPGARFEGTPTFEAFTAALSRPRRIVMMIPAGKPVDMTIDKLKPLLDRGDVLIDGGNSWFEDTRRREAALRPTGIHFVGCGVSGGEEGARFGPSLMPGGAEEAWVVIRDVLESIAARTEAGPCVTHVGPDGAGHFVKMVHNGIEYGDMQLIAESWDILRRGLGLSAPETADVFETWNDGPLASFLTELTAKVCRTVDPDTKKPLVDIVLDKAGQKGT
jgi:6-phosphogluconate dehydrogenase